MMTTAAKPTTTPTSETAPAFSSGFGFDQETPSVEPNFGFVPETRKPIPIRNRARVPLKTRQRQRQPLPQAQDMDMGIPSFESPRAAFQVCLF